MTVATRSRTWTWQRLVEIEPRLAALEGEIRAIKPGRGFCANAVWYGYARRPSLKDRMSRLVGWDATNPALRDPKAYDVAYQHLYKLLPDCRHDGMLC